MYYWIQHSRAVITPVVYSFKHFVIVYIMMLSLWSGVILTTNIASGTWSSQDHQSGYMYSTPGSFRNTTKQSSSFTIEQWKNWKHISQPQGELEAVNKDETDQEKPLTHNDQTNDLARMDVKPASIAINISL